MNSENFKIGACALIYKGAVLGAIVNGPILKMESTYQNITCDQAFDQPIGKQLRLTAVTLTAEIREITTGMDLLMDANGRITVLEVGDDIKNTGSELLLIPFNRNDAVGYRFPKAVLLKKTEYSFLEDREHAMQLEFDALMDAQGVLMERFTVDDSQRIAMNATDIDPAQIERGLTKYIASQLDLTVDQDIFRGGIFLGKDGFGVELVEESLSNTPGLRTIKASVECLNVDRDYVFKSIYTLAGLFPVYGVTVSTANGDITFRAILKDDVSFSTDAGSGRIKTLGKLEFTLKI